MLPSRTGNRQRQKKSSGLSKPKIKYTDDGFAVTTLYLKSLGKKINRDQLLSYFSTFGNVQNVRIHTKASCSFGFVTFARAESAARALAKAGHKIDGREIDVAIADSWHQENPLELSDSRKKSRKSVPIEQTNVTGTRLLDLNDDCLYEIFSLKYVNIMDLCSVAETSARLKEIATRIFTASHKSCDFNEMSLKTLHEMRRFLINFGSSINELKVGPSYEFGPNFEEMSVRVMDQVIRYCSKTLVALKLRGYDITEFVTEKLRPMFEKLQLLHIENGFIMGDGKLLFSNCGALVELKVYNLENDDVGMIFENQFPALERFKFEKDFGHYGGYDLQLFVARHKALKEFTIREFYDDCSPLLPVIADSCKDLEKLQITGHVNHPPLEYATALKSLLTLSRLKKLKIKCCNVSVTKFIQELSQLSALEHLELWEAQGDAEFIPALSQLKSLNVLRLRYCKNLMNVNALADLKKLHKLSILFHSPTTEEIELNVVDMIKRLVNLKKLTIGLDTFKLDKQLYLKLVNIVRKRTSRLSSPLEIKLYQVDYGAIDLQLDGKNIDFVKLKRICYGSDADDDFDPFFLDDDDYDDDDDFDPFDDDYDGESDFEFSPAFLLPFFHQRLFDNIADSDEEDDNEENVVW